MEKISMDYINDKLYNMGYVLRLYIAAQDLDSAKYKVGAAYGFLEALLYLDIITYGQYSDALDIFDEIAANRRKDVPKCIIV